jgi:excisionase family DNA binding protein
MDDLAAPRHSRYLTIDEVAEKLAVTPQSVRHWIDSRRLSAVCFADGVVRIPRRSFETFTSRSAAHPTKVAPIQPGNVAERLRQLEDLFQMTSSDFYRQWGNGEFREDDPLYGEWALLLDFCRTSETPLSTHEPSVPA